MFDKLKKILLIAGDFLVLYAALYAALFIRYGHQPFATAEWSVHFMPFSLLFIIWVVVFYINGLFEITASKNDIEFFNKVFVSIIINFAIGGAYFYLLTDRLFDIKPRGLYFIFIGLTFVLLLAWRYWYNSLLFRQRFLKNVLVIGMKDEARELIEEIIKKPQFGYKIKAIISSNYLSNNPFPGVQIYDSAENLKKILNDNNINTVVTALDPHANPLLVQSLYESLALKIRFFDLPTFYEKLSGKIPVTSIGHIWFLENLAESEKGVYEFFKRGIDVAVAGLGLILSIPVIPMISILIKLDSDGPIFFRQQRIGKLGRPFEAIKFRSMIVGAEKNGEAQWAQKNDSRVTRIGRILRKTRLDEIPQFLNVVRGEMSLVGPRPERPEFVRDLQRDIPFYNERHLVRPGLSGWAQINFQYGASTRDAFKKLQFDLFYIKNRSLLLDFGIVLKTINIILRALGR